MDVQSLGAPLGAWREGIRSSTMPLYPTRGQWCRKGSGKSVVGFIKILGSESCDFFCLCHPDIQVERTVELMTTTNIIGDDLFIHSTYIVDLIRHRHSVPMKSIFNCL